MPLPEEYGVDQQQSPLAHAVGDLAVASRPDPPRRDEGAVHWLLFVTPGQVHDGPPCLSSDDIRVPRSGRGRPRTHQLSRLATRLTFRKSAEILTRRHTGRHTERADQQADRKRKGRMGGRPRTLDPDLQAQERCSKGRSHQAGGLAARYDKLAIACRSAAVMIWLRGWETRPSARRCCAGRPATPSGTQLVGEGAGAVSGRQKRGDLPSVRSLASTGVVVRPPVGKPVQAITRAPATARSVVPVEATGGLLLPGMHG